MYMIIIQFGGYAAFKFCFVMQIILFVNTANQFCFKSYLL